MKQNAIILAVCLGSAATAQPDPFLGTRCSTNEDIHVEPGAIGFNEHTVCDWQDGPIIKAYSLHGVIDCRNIYVTDASADPVTTQTLDQGTRHLRLVLVDDVDMDVYLDRVPLGRFGACG